MLHSTLFTIAIFFGLFVPKKNMDLPTVKAVDLNKYAGKWYEIAKLPNRFEKGLQCITATYTVKKNGKVEVLNGGRRIKDNKIQNIKGTARVPNNAFPGKLKVTFFWPFSGDYYIMELDENYTYALVGSPSRDYLWILSRTPELEETTYNMLLAKAKEQGFDISKVEKVNQFCK